MNKVKYLVFKRPPLFENRSKLQTVKTTITE